MGKQAIPWKRAERNFVKTNVEKGVHPVDFQQPLNDKFKNSRTMSAIYHQVVAQRLSLRGCEAQTSTPTKKESLSVVRRDIRINKLERQLKILNRKYHMAVEDASVQKEIVELLNDYITALPEATPPKPLPVAKGTSEEELILLLSDIHAGEDVKREEMNDLNEYNFDICIRRLKKLSDSVRSIARDKLSGYTFKKLNIFGLGDFISGQIHAELVENAKGNVVEWTVNLAFVLAQMLQELACDFETIEFTGIVGNHGRMHNKPRFKARYINWDFICYQMLSLFLANQRNIQFDIPQSFWTLKEVNGKHFLLIHGDNVQSYRGIPWYGIQRMVANLKELIAAKDKKFDYIVLGHFHNMSLLDRVKGELIINGSVIGGNEFAIGKMFTSSEACQFFCGVHHNYGVTFRYKLNIQEVNQKGDVPYKYVGSPRAYGDLVRELT